MSDTAHPFEVHKTQKQFGSNCGGKLTVLGCP
jgi:hypothetical protein